MKKKVFFLVASVAIIAFAGTIMSFNVFNTSSKKVLVKDGLCLKSIPAAKFVCWFSGSECTKALDTDVPTGPEQSAINTDCNAISVNNFKCIVITSPFTQIPCVAANGFRECDPAAYNGGALLPKDDVQPDLRDGVISSQNENKTACINVEFDPE